MTLHLLMQKQNDNKRGASRLIIESFVQIYSVYAWPQTQKQIGFAVAELKK